MVLPDDGGGGGAAAFAADDDAAAVAAAVVGAAPLQPRPLPPVSWRHPPRPHPPALPLGCRRPLDCCCLVAHISAV